jgi:hypothetical protein
VVEVAETELLVPEVAVPEVYVIVDGAMKIDTWSKVIQPTDPLKVSSKSSVTKLPAKGSRS